MLQEQYRHNLTRTFQSKKHTFMNGVCDCDAIDPTYNPNGNNTGDVNSPTTPQRPSVPSVPTNSTPVSPSEPDVITTVTETAEQEEEEIISDEPYLEDVSSGAADDSDDGGIPDMSMEVIALAVAAAVVCAVLIKKLIF